jgi:glycosyltransferase involved in cell wall biosynthesis
MILHGVSIHTGGGKVLLDQLLREATLGEITHLICDERYELPRELPHGIKIYRTPPTLFKRLKAEFLLREIAEKNPSEMVLCFSNLPPIFRLQNPVILFLQNALLLPGEMSFALNLKVRLRILFEKFWLNLFLNHVSEVWVQTRWMKKSFQRFFNCPVEVRPIRPSLPAPVTKNLEWDFISVTGSAAHKHLKELILAWKLLPTPRPKLLILSDTPTPEISEALKNFGDPNLTFKWNVTREEVFEFYQRSRTLLLTSKLESYCLPLYEAIHFGLKIIAPKEDYVVEATSPDEYIQELTPEGISSAVLRFDLNKIGS